MNEYERKIQTVGELREFLNKYGDDIPIEYYDEQKRILEKVFFA